MHAAANLLQDQQNPKELHPAKCNAGCTPVVVTTTDDTPTSNSNTEDAPAANSVERTPTASARAWHYSAMSAAACALSALLGYIATEAIFKRIRGRN